MLLPIAADGWVYVGFFLTGWIGSAFIFLVITLIVDYACRRK